MGPTESYSSHRGHRLRDAARRETILFRGCHPEVAADGMGVILGVGKEAAALAGPRARVVELEGRVLPGLADSHVHLDWLAEDERWVRLTPAEPWEKTLGSLREAARRVPGGAWLLARGLPGEPTSQQAAELERVASNRPLLALTPDAHSGFASHAALARSGLLAGPAPGQVGVIRRAAGGLPTGFLQEEALDLVVRQIPPLTPVRRRRLTLKALRRLAAAGLTSVHAMDSQAGFEALAALHRSQGLPLRITWFAPASAATELIREGIEAGWGDERLRIFGVKAFLDGTLGSGTAALLDGGGVLRMSPAEIRALAQRLYSAGLNLAVHAIGDRAVRVALDAFAQLPRAPFWRPRIEHAQLVHESDLERFAAGGVIASMQPVHAPMDFSLAEARWRGRTGGAYAWGALWRAGARLAFGSDAPVASFDPLLGLDAASGWRKRLGWHPELALTRRQALWAYSAGAAYAVGLERRLGRLAAGRWCDLTVVKDGKVVATVVAAEVVSPR